MVDSIQGNIPVNSIKSTIVRFQNIQANNKLGVFGFGQVNNTPDNPIAKLAEKFNFDAPVYNRGVAQLDISDLDYVSDKDFKENAFCEV